MGYPVKLLNWRNGYSILGRLSLIQFLNSVHPNVIHDHSITPFSRIFMRIGGNCPLISTRHGNSIPDNHFKFALSKIDDRFTNLVIANSEFTAHIHSKLYHRPMSKIRTVYLGLDLERYGGNYSGHMEKQLNVTQKKTNKTKILFAGRLEEYKGVLLLPLLAKALINKGINDFEILVAGEGTARKACEKTTSKLGLSNYITFLGWQSDLINVFQQADLFIFPSIIEEGFGLAPLEALAAGLPVVAYATGGVREALREHQEPN